ncbi:MAG: hypothetical protein V3U54_08685 [Thermodesulfobacteriota bacterium]
MTTYKSYPTVKDTPNRMNRKHARKDVFEYNKYQAKKEAKKLREKEKEEKAKAEEAKAEKA